MDELSEKNKVIRLHPFLENEGCDYGLVPSDWDSRQRC